MHAHFVFDLSLSKLISSVSGLESGALSVAAPAELMITGREGKVVGNNYRAAFKDTDSVPRAGALAFHPQQHRLEPSTSAAAEATGGLVITPSGTPAVCTWPAGGSMCVCLDSVNVCINVVCSLCSITR